MNYKTYFLTSQTSIPCSLQAKLFILVLAIKFATAIYINYLTVCSAPEVRMGKIAVAGGDTFSYLNPIDNYIKYNSYFFTNNKGEKSFAGRMPYYGTVYYLIKLIVPSSHTYDAFVVLQIILECWSIILLSLLCYKITRLYFSFWLAYFLLIISLNTSIWSLMLLTESLSTSFLIAFLYYYSAYLNNSNRSLAKLFSPSLFLAFVVLLKPYFILLYVLLSIEFILNKSGYAMHIFIYNTLKRLIVVSGILIMFLLPWTIRNYKMLNKFIPLQASIDAGYGFNKSFVACTDFIKAWGGSVIYWDKKSAGCYFIRSENINCQFSFPDYALSKSYDVKDIEKVREKYIILQKMYSDSLDNIVSEEFRRLTYIYKNEQPIRYFIISPLILIKEFLFHSGSYYLPINHSFACYKPYQILLKIVQSVLYYTTLSLGSVGLIALVVKGRNNFIFLSIPLLLILIFPITLRLTEWRYFTTAYPVLIIGLVYLISSGMTKLNIRF